MIDEKGRNHNVGEAGPGLSLTQVLEEPFCQAGSSGRTPTVEIRADDRGLRVDLPYCLFPRIFAFSVYVDRTGLVRLGIRPRASIENRIGRYVNQCRADFASGIGDMARHISVESEGPIRIVFALIHIRRGRTVDHPIGLHFGQQRSGPFRVN